MVVTQENLVRQIARREGIDVATVRDIFKSAEDVIFDHLSSTSPSKNMTIKILNGLYIERNYSPAKKYSKGVFEDIECPERVRVKAKLTKHFNQKINKELF